MTKQTLEKVMKKKIIETVVLEYTENELPTEYFKLVEKAKEQLPKAWAPYSRFHVGAAVLLESGKVYAASNQENSAYPSGLCAERTAMFFANAQEPEVAVKAIAVAAFTNGKLLKNSITPCGGCRQVLLETEQRFGKDITVILYGTEKVQIIGSVKQLLPLCFEKNSLINNTD